MTLNRITGNMDRIKLLLLIIATALTTAACVRENPMDGPSSETTDGTLTVTPSDLSFPVEGKTLTFSIETEAEWRAMAAYSWASLDQTAGSGSATVSVTVGENAAETSRSTSIRVWLPGNSSVSATVQIVQSGSEESADPEEKGTVIPRSAFTQPSEWGLTGSLLGMNWGLDGTPDIPLKAEPGGWVACFDVEVASGDELKFRKNADWNANFGTGAGQPKIDRKYTLVEDGGNIKLAAGTYDFYLHPTYLLLYVEKAGDEFAHGDAKADQGEQINTRVYILNNSSWNTPYLYAYGPYEALGGWPGTYASGTRKWGEYTWTYWDVAAFAGAGGVNFILNDGGSNQYPPKDTQDELWSNLTIHSDLYFTWDGTTLRQVDDPSEPGVDGKGTEPKEMKFGTSSWTVIGTLGGTNWDYDFPMDTEGYWEVAREVAVAAGEQLKFRQNRSWAGSNLGFGPYSDTQANLAAVGEKLALTPGGGNITLSESGTYDIYINLENSIGYILKSGTAWTHEAEGKPDYVVSGPYDPEMAVSGKGGGITYQLNVFSFKDSDGDGYGDFNGITSSLDYFDRLGVTALWLSPSQPAQSYHGYDVIDYSSLNPRYGTEEDFQRLVTEAHRHNIRIYMDYVINHAGDQSKWFLDVKEKGPASPYWSYFSLSKDPAADVAAGKIAQIPASYGYDTAKWFPVLIGGTGKQRYRIDLDWTNASAPTITVSTTTADVAVNTADTGTNPPRYLYTGSYYRFLDNGSNKYYMVLDYQSSWGCLVRTRKDDVWKDMSKWGFSGTGQQLKEGQAHVLYSNDDPDKVQAIVMPGGDLYYYYSEFRTGMFVDFNYGPAESCSSSDAFKAIVESVDKWLAMGVDGFRLDAVKHIYANETGPENKQFWKAFYSACNTLYKKYASKRTGLSGIVDENIFMVGEVFSSDGDCTPFYEGLPSIFDFQFWWDLQSCLLDENIWRAGYGKSFPGSLKMRWDNHYQVRDDAITTTKLANHDEDRTASKLGRFMPKIRLAGSVLLTATGRPYIYQGEELGYWGTKAGGDEYVRTPILWTASQSSAASRGVSNKVDWSMLTPAISVEAQSADETSLLTLYRRLAYLRNTNPAFDGWPEPDELAENGYDSHIAGWYMHAVDGSGQVVLVLHNFSPYTTDVKRWANQDVSMDRLLFANGHVSVSGNLSDGMTVSLPPYGSAVFNVVPAQ